MNRPRPLGVDSGFPRTTICQERVRETRVHAPGRPASPAKNTVIWKTRAVARLLGARPGILNGLLKRAE
jgi:hypothetical protein